MSVLALLAGIAAITIWRMHMSPGDAFAFCMISLLLVWPFFCVVSGLLWGMSGTKSTLYYLIMAVAAVAEPVLAYIEMLDLTAFILGVLGTILPAAAGLAIGRTIKSKQNQ